MRQFNSCMPCTELMLLVQCHLTAFGTYLQFSITSPSSKRAGTRHMAVHRCYYDYWVGGGVGTLDYGEEGFLQNCVDDPECVAVSGHSSERFQAYKIVAPAPNAGSNHMTREECNAQVKRSLEEVSMSCSYEGVMSLS